MATNKTLTPTNVTIQIPEFTDQPDQRVNSNCIDKEADAINALNGNMVKNTSFSGTISSAGLVALGVNGANKVIVGIDVAGSIALPYKDTYNYWYAKIINVSTMQPVTSGDISGTVYYKD